jgi:hypothetical protein
MILGLALTAAACGDERGASPEEAVSAIPLEFRPIESTDLGMPKPRPGEWATTIAERRIAGGTAYVYTLKEVPEHIYGAVAFDGEEFALGVGPIGGPQQTYDSETVSIVEMQLVGKSVVRFKGVYGANAPVTVYAESERDMDDIVLLRVDTGHAAVVDLDGDGTEEVVSEYGTPQSTYVYRWDGERFETADVNEALQADSVRFVPEEGLFAAESTGEPSASRYRYSAQGLTHVPAE